AGDRIVPATTAATPATAAAAVATPVQQSTVNRGLPTFADIVEQQGPAVVQIRATKSISGASLERGQVPGERGQMPGMPQLPPEFAPFFRGLPLPGIPQTPRPTLGTGSGFIVGADGIVLTNAHVVADADEVVVKLTDQREFAAKVLGSDAATDVAVLKIE